MVSVVSRSEQRLVHSALSCRSDLGRLLRQCRALQTLVGVWDTVLSAYVCCSSTPNLPHGTVEVLHYLHSSVLAAVYERAGTGAMS